MMLSYYKGMNHIEVPAVAWISYDHKTRELTYGYRDGARHLIEDIYVYEVFDDAQR